ncbi:hypothetical protein GCM10023084_15420 [Streptomyces lacrimifluminis]|uniref:Uncharacterized protein n=1 Tax=Streptomyces lacrimifluminis TaxID=1500077 RepID=A0A917KLC7_9ACTN|nr:hypothetical protein [Streptomyces lacrimifluminis]GGJ16853.1 hypothetical protein GCM10012282_11290 [Streptomyces lacrimifluminis]
MGTAERREALGNSVAAPLVVRGGLRSISTGRGMDGGKDSDGTGPSSASVEQLSRPVRAEAQPSYRQLWVEEPARRRRLPDSVRTAAVRAVLVISVTLIQAMVAFLSTLAGSWLAFPMVISSVASTVVATWAALDVWVTRQVWRQRNGVVSTPSSTARALRRERRKARRHARATARTQERIRRQGGGSGQLSHP